MPIYQYNCATCKKRVEVFFRSVSAAEGAEPACPDCGGKQLQRLMSTFARTRSTKQRLDDIDQAQVQARLQTHDLGQFARWAKEAGREYDEDLGTNYRELAERAEAGEDLVDRVDADYTFSERVEMRRIQLEDAADGGTESSSADPYGQWFPDETR
ncbi:MAG: zinc ribbon domain-containing protein [Chloroflexi bacterium]|nr:MAG: zinc ribbon domain-containing protein [Chloroflexota bacterium]